MTSVQYITMKTNGLDCDFYIKFVFGKDPMSTTQRSQILPSHRSVDNQASFCMCTHIQYIAMWLVHNILSGWYVIIIIIIIGHSLYVFIYAGGVRTATYVVLRRYAFRIFAIAIAIRILYSFILKHQQTPAFSETNLWMKN